MSVAAKIKRAAAQWLRHPCGGAPQAVDRPVAVTPPGVVVQRERVDAAMAQARAERLPWALDRATWRAEGSPDLDIVWVHGRRCQPPCLVPDAELEVATIRLFLRHFERPREAIAAGRIGPTEFKKVPPAERLAADRQEDFASGKRWIQSQSVLAGRDYVEDTREAILLGRKFGYFEQDILAYLVRNDVPEAYRAIKDRRPVPATVLEVYPELMGSASGEP